MWEEISNWKNWAKWLINTIWFKVLMGILIGIAISYGILKWVATW